MDECAGWRNLCRADTIDQVRTPVGGMLGQLPHPADHGCAVSAGSRLIALIDWVHPRSPYDRGLSDGGGRAVEARRPDRRYQE